MTAQALPPSLAPLAELALDLRWTWSHAADALWRRIAPELWEQTKNPWAVLSDAAAATLAQLSSDSLFQSELARLVAERRAYLDARTWCADAVPELEGELVAYFSMEFGLGEAVPLYAGGLGILAGDHLKAASDLGVPVVGVGVLFQEGYFRQRLGQGGWQDEAYPYNDPGSLPIAPVASPAGGQLRVAIALPGRRVWLRVWRARVGRVDLYLLDANDPANSPVDRGITTKLYGGSAETRLLQEIVLGVGGWRALRALGLAPSVAHMNEGHAALVVLERAASFMVAARTSFADALLATRAGNVFTTHTPVRAGFDEFAPDLASKYVTGDLLDAPGVSVDELLALGRVDPSDPRAPFDMAYLALRGAGRVNAVSRLHGATSRRLFAPLFPRWPEAEVPIEHVTNGVHVPSWDSRAADAVWTSACGKGRWLGSIEPLCDVASTLGDDELWAMRTEQRTDLLRFARRHLERQLGAHGVGEAAAEVAARVFDPDILTIGFARRFAEYKRPDLLLRDPDRLARLLLDPRRPVQIVVAGKAHPADDAGKRMIAEWIAFMSRPDVRSRAVFLEDYDIALAEHMVQGVDVWINTPRRPWEACGTSGMKVLVNGGLNVSVLDGWWAEAWSPDVGWAIGDGEPARSDADDAEDLYRVLEAQIAPEFYDRDVHRLPRRWLARVRASLSQLTPTFSAARMTQEYATRLYAPAAAAHRRRASDGAKEAKALRAWRDALAAAWPDIRFGDVRAARRGDAWDFTIEVDLGDVAPGSVAIELYADARDGAAPERHAAKRDADAGAHVYAASVPATRDAGDYTARVIPERDGLLVPMEAPFIAWQR